MCCPSFPPFMPGAMEYAVTSEAMAAISLAVASLQQAAEGACRDSMEKEAKQTLGKPRSLHVSMGIDRLLNQKG